MILFYTKFALQQQPHHAPRLARRGYHEAVEQGRSCNGMVMRAHVTGENIERAMDHVVLVVPGAIPAKPLLSSFGYQGAGSRTGSIIDCGTE